jgi:hypothetical protein
MCPRNAFSTAIIDAGSGIKIEIRGGSVATCGIVGCIVLRFFQSLLKTEIVTFVRASTIKTETTALTFAKISSPTLAGDFGARVACASEHHFFLDITFY